MGLTDYLKISFTFFQSPSSPSRVSRFFHHISGFYPRPVDQTTGRGVGGQPGPCILFFFKISFLFFTFILLI